MVKKTEKHDIGNVDIENIDLDFDADPGLETEDNRDPALRVATGFLSGVKESITDPNIIRRSVLEALPRGYEEAYNVLDTAANRGSGLYHQMAKDLKPSIRDFKRAARQAKGLLDPVLSKSISDKLDNWLKSDMDATRRYEQNPQEAAISSELVGIFKAQVDSQEETRAAQMVGEQLSDQRHKTNVGLLDDIRRNMSRLVAYQDSITVNYQRKSLELQFRQLYAAKDHLELARGYSAESVTLLRNIQKNTGLPDQVKVQGGEILNQLLQENLYGKLQESLVQSTSGFMRQLFENITNRGKEFVGGVKDGLSTGTELLDYASMVDPDDVDGHTAGGKAAGAIAGDWAAGKLSSLFKNSKWGQSDTVKKFGNRAGRWARHLPDEAQAYARSDTEQYGILGDIIDFGKSLIPQGPRKQAIGANSLENSANPRPFDNLAHRTLVDIIPGYLARLLQSSERARLGTDDVELERFDQTRQEFVSQSQASSRLLRRVIPKYAVDSTADESARFVDKILGADVDPALKKKIQQELIERSMEGKGFNPDNFTNARGFKTLKDEDAKKAADLFSKAFSREDDTTESGITEAMDQYRRLRQSIPLMENQANAFANTGSRDLLRQTGVVTQRGSRDVINDSLFAQLMKDFIGSGSNYEQAIGQASSSSTGLPASNSVRSADVYRRAGVSSSYSPSVSGYQTGDQPGMAFERFDYSKLTTEVDRIIEAVTTESTKTQAEASFEVLGQILEAIRSLELGGGGSYNPNNDQAIIRKSTILKAGGGLVRGLWGASKRLYGAGAWARDKTIGAAVGGAKLAGKAAGGLFDWARRKVVADVYTPDDLKTPKLVGYKMRAGQYFDVNSKKVIKTVNDIKGAVKDLETGDIVLSAEDFEKGVVDGKGEKLVTSSVKWAAGKIGWGAGLLGSTTWKSMTLPFKVLSAANWARRHILFRPTDVYVPGEQKPRLLATLLLNGGYFSSRTGKPIKSIGDIDSDVVDREGEVKLSLEEFAAGVVDSKGKPIRTMASRIKGLLTKAKDLAVGTVKFGARQVGRGFKMMGSLAAGAGRILTGAAPNIHFGGKFSGGVNPEQHSVLVKIHNLLCRHFGDGEEIEDPSLTGVVGKAKGFAQKAKGKLAGAKDKAVDVAESVTSKLRSVFASALGKEESDLDGKETMWERLKKRSKEFRAGSAADIQARRAAKGIVPEAKADKAAKPEGGGWGGKMLAIVMGIGGLLKTAVGKIGDLVTGFFGLRKAILAMSAAKAGVDLADSLGGGDIDMDRDGKRKPGGKRPGKLARVGGALRTGAGFLGRGALMAGGGLLTAGSAVAGTLASGVGATLGALFSAPVLIGLAVAGAGYLAYKGYQHYKGSIGPMARARVTQYGADPDDNTQCRLLMEFEQGLKEHVTFKGETANIEGKIDYTKWLEHFGFDPEKSSHVEVWGTWYQNRFKPVFTRWLKLIQLTQPGVALESLDEDLKDDQKSEFIRKTKFNRRDISPYPYDVTELPFLGTGAPKGTSRIDAEIKAVWERYKDKAVSKVAPGTIVTTEAGKSTVTSALGQAPKARSDSQSISVAGSLKYVSQGAMEASPVVKRTSGVSDFSYGRSRVIDDLTALRVKTYGLRDLDVAKVNTLLDLEDTVIKELQILPSGQASFSQPADRYFTEFAGKFGLAESDVEQQAIWQLWFLQRFVPTVLNYVAAVRKLDKTVSFTNVVAKLTREGVVTVAEAIRSSKTDIQGKKVSVWSVLASPFVDYPVNADSGTVKTHYLSLENKVNSITYKEPTPFAAKPTVTGKDGAGTKAAGVLMPDFGGPQPALTQAQKEAVAPKPKYDNFVSKNPTLISGAGDGGKGTYAEIPKPKGSGTWAAIKDTIIAAARAVGVDPGVLGAFAKIESTYNPNAVNKMTNAAGLMQFLPSTWKDMIKLYAERFGVPKSASPTDPVASALFGASYIKWNQERIEPRVGRPLTATDMYAAHFLGHANAVKLMRADPNEIAADLFPGPARSNPQVFYRGGRAVTIAELYKWLDDKVSGNIPAVDPSLAGDPANEDKDVLAANGLNAANKSFGDVGGLPAGTKRPAPSAPNTPTAPLRTATAAPGALLGSSYANSAARTQPVTASTGSKPKPTPAERDLQLAASNQVQKQRQQAQQTELAQFTAKGTVDSVSVLKESLLVQKAMEGHLGAIAKTILSAVKKMSEDTSTAVAPTPTPAPQARPQARPMETMPVNLARRV